MSVICNIILRLLHRVLRVHISDQTVFHKQNRVKLMVIIFKQISGAERHYAFKYDLCSARLWYYMLAVNHQGIENV